MEYRVLGRTSLRVSALGFGCGNVGGLMVRGTPAERERAVARALELGVNFFDTAPAYGDGVSEQHLGQALQALQAQCLVATKVRLGADGLADPATAVTRSLETSLRRLRRDRVDLLQLHDPVRATRAGGEPRGGRGPRADPAGVRGPATGRQDRLRRDDGARRHTGGPPRARLGRGGLGAGVLQPAEPERRLRRASGLPGPGLRPAPRPGPARSGSASW